MQELFGNLWNLQWQQVVMWGIGGLLIWLAIKKEMEPSLLLPMGFGAILVNLPLSGAVTQVLSTGTEVGPLDVLFDAGIANELFPLLLFVGIGAMIDFTPLLSNPKLMIFGAAAQFGIFFTLGAATLMGFELKDAASIAVIGAADGPTSIFVANFLESNYLGAIIVAAYSYMALVPIIQPPVIRLVTTKKERLIRMAYAEKQVSKTAKILFPIIITMVAGLFVPRSVALVGFLMFGNLIRECGVLDSLSETAQKVLANLITLLLGLTAAGLVLLPVLSVAQGFFLSFSVGCFARALGRGGVYLALAAFGPRCLFVLPCTLLLTVQGLSAAARRRDGQKVRLTEGAYWRRVGLCGLILLIGAALELTFGPRLLQWVIARTL